MSEPTFQIILTLTEDQQHFLEFAVGEWGRSAWKYALGAELEPEAYRRTGEEDEVDPVKQLEYAKADIGNAEAILGQMPGGAIRFWRETLSDEGIGDDGEES